MPVVVDAYMTVLRHLPSAFAVWRKHGRAVAPPPPRAVRAVINAHGTPLLTIHPTVLPVEQPQPYRFFGCLFLCLGAFAFRRQPAAHLQHLNAAALCPY